MTKKCRWCGTAHETRCPLVKAIEYHANGRIKRVEFLTPGDYPAPLVQPYTTPATPPWPPIGTIPWMGPGTTIGGGIGLAPNGGPFLSWNGTLAQ